MRPIFFCHIPKAAGTSLRLALEAGLDQDQIVPNRAFLAAHKGLYPSLAQSIAEVERMGDAVRLFSGHYHLSAAGVLRNPLTIVVLRDPVARAASHVNHAIRHREIGRRQALALLDDGQVPPMVPDNLMTRMLSGTVARLPRQDKSWRNPITMAIDDPPSFLADARHALGRVSVVGFAEDMAGLARALAASGIAIEIGLHNRAPEPLALSERQLDTLRNANRLDLALYEWARTGVGAAA